MARVGVLLGVLAAARAAPPESPQGFAGWPRTVAEIHTRGGALRFNVTVADTPERQARGLMFVRALDADEGMWFPQQQPRAMQMWMKNTLIPLDLLFVDAQGKIACIRARATPLSTAIIDCPRRVAGVLEIGGGEAQRRGILPGDAVAVAGWAAAGTPAVSRGYFTRRTRVL
ncbi:MAG: DUF192 domain-containing protein [Gammaproteobacteria bacterium]|nr:DUF192 domain-containing protein [Gammaproteobacteria bacterium]